jgi:hypothetical protein
VLRLTQKGRNFENLSKLKKNVKKALFSYTLSNILQFGVNSSAPNLKWCVQWIQEHLLTPLGSLGNFFFVVAPPSIFFILIGMRYENKKNAHRCGHLESFFIQLNELGRSVKLARLMSIFTSKKFEKFH